MTSDGEPLPLPSDERSALCGVACECRSVSEQEPHQHFFAQDITQIDARDVSTAADPLMSTY